MTTLAKILAGGLPGGAIVGRDIMEQLDHVKTAATGREKIPHHGTFNGGPLSAAAGVATLELIATTDACQRANDYAARLRESLNRVLRDEQVPWVVYGTFSGFHIFTDPGNCVPPPRTSNRDASTIASSRRRRGDRWPSSCGWACLLHGVDIFSWPGGPTSAVHTTDTSNARPTPCGTRSARCAKKEGSVRKC